MNTQIINIIGLQFFKKTFTTKGFFILWVIFVSVQVYVTITGWNGYHKQHHIRKDHKEKARKSWENNPDKHPHRMAHFGTFAFRLQHPLSVFDSGIESYTGNVMFLEAHKQHTANFSEASLSTGIVRFGKLNSAILLQLILPLILFFLGFSSIAGEQENGTLKIMYAQGVTVKELLLGKFLGLFYIAILFFLPALCSLWSISFMESIAIDSETIMRSLLLSVAYVVYYVILCFITVILSAKSSSSKKALLTLLVIWVIFFVVFPKTVQVIGSYVYPSPTKAEFKAMIEQEVSKKGNSHDPNDPHFISLRDSIMNVYNVKDVKELPFNYSGFLMRKGEEQTAAIFNKHQQDLITTFKKQNKMTNLLALINPFLAIKNISMSLSGTDFNTYTSFLLQAEDYRYKQSQYLNNLQMKYISNTAKGSEGKVHVVKKKFWKDFSDFHYKYDSLPKVLLNSSLSIISFGLWVLFIGSVLVKFSNSFKIK